jgi:excisionase family DNA binding protein
MEHRKSAYPITEAAHLLSIGRSKFYELMDAGEIRSFNIGNRRLIAAEDIDAYVAKCRNASQVMA